MQPYSQQLPAPDHALDSFEVVPDTRSSRRQLRHEYEVDVSFESDHNFYTGFTENISSGGLFIATRGELPAIGTRFSIRVNLPTAASAIELRCEVRWQRLDQECAHSYPGVGVRFVDLDASAAAAINAFISKRDTLFYFED